MYLGGLAHGTRAVTIASDFLCYTVSRMMSMSIAIISTRGRMELRRARTICIETEAAVPRALSPQAGVMAFVTTLDRPFGGMTLQDVTILCILTKLNKVDSFVLTQRPELVSLG